MVFIAIANRENREGEEYTGRRHERVTNDKCDLVCGQISTSERSSILQWLDAVPLLSHDEVVAIEHLFEPQGPSSTPERPLRDVFTDRERVTLPELAHRGTAVSMTSASHANKEDTSG